MNAGLRPVQRKAAASTARERTWNVRERGAQPPTPRCGGMSPA